MISNRTPLTGAEQSRNWRLMARPHRIPFSTPAHFHRRSNRVGTINKLFLIMQETSVDQEQIVIGSEKILGDH